MSSQTPPSRSLPTQAPAFNLRPSSTWRTPRPWKAGPRWDANLQQRARAHRDTHRTPTSYPHPASASGIWHSCWLREGHRLGVRRVPYCDLESPLLPSQDFGFICPGKSNTCSSHHWWGVHRRQIQSSFHPYKVLLWHLQIINPLKDEVWKLGSEWLSNLPKAVEQRFELMTAWPQNSTLPQTPRSSRPIISGAGVAETLPCSPCPEEPTNGRAFNLANKDTGHPINFEFQIKSEFYFLV